LVLHRFELTSQGDLLGKSNRVIDELHHQYALGFVPQKFDGKLHDLTVKVNESGCTVHARKRYLAPRGSGTSRHWASEQEFTSRSGAASHGSRA